MTAVRLQQTSIRSRKLAGETDCRISPIIHLSAIRLQIDPGIQTAPIETYNVHAKEFGDDEIPVIVVALKVTVDDFSIVSGIVHALVI
ncbi:hypothetical protein DPMN_123121 [Dreissena polymorpha]|uniref:Uncharacterized protein n=1 Tax=Dreissena polymorpha TaxID=45954 RepID=A0A9D4GWT6_DREPO|nr:hypothetical protein DPMN_123121 [Dreissena polymorpha]